MKTIIQIILLLSLSIYANAQLNSSASYIKEKYPTEYENIFKKHAVEEWSTNYEMVAFMINNQADALVSLIKTFESDNTQIVFEAIIEWSFEGYENSNIKLFKEFDTFSLENLVKLHCNWEMVTYAYENQVKAKNSL